MEKILSESQIKILRNRSIITSQEIALMSGDLFVAEDVITRERRVLHNASDVLKESKKLLKG